jgi:uncharacterized protein YlaI
MLLDKEVKVKTKYNYDIDYYKSIGYEIDSELIIVKIEDLPKKSSTIVNVSCDYCEKIEKISYYKFIRSQNSVIKKYCCKDCKGKKIKESNLLKYGVTSVAKLKSSKEKSKKTNFEKWGVENPMQSDIVKNNLRKNNLAKFGVENPMQNLETKNKQKETLIKLYSVDNISKVEEVKEKKKKTTFINFGVDVPLKSEIIKEKVKETNLKKYEKEFFTQSNEWRNLNYKITKDPFYLEYIENSISKFKCDFGLLHDFEITKDVYFSRKNHNISLCTVCNPVGENRSIKEGDLFNIISELYPGEVIQTFREGRMEIDIFIPHLKLGFEFNGLYWHSDLFKDKNFHLNKTEYFKAKGIRLVHIWEDDWDFNRDIVISQIKHLLGVNKSNVVFARKCSVKEIVNTKDVKTFLNINHIQGFVTSKIKLGLYYEGELVSIMTFDHFEGRKKMGDGEWNLNRFCNKRGMNIPGSASKLLKYFIKNFNPKRLVSYADRSWSDGDLYNKLGFKIINVSGSDYKYIIGNRRINKSRFRKSRTGISENKLDLLKIWDCGKIKFEYYSN